MTVQMAEEAKKTYADMRQKISALAKKINELDAERSEYDLVVRTLEGMDGARACYRMTGGVLVERTVKEVMPAVAKNLEGIEKVIETLMKQLKDLETESGEFRAKHNLAMTRDSGDDDTSATRSSGILA